MSLKGITPHKVSRDLRGYSVMFYGDFKSGKTTVASKFPKAILLAFEKGYAALDGVYADPINSWADFLKDLKELESEEVKEQFETVVIDTADIAYSYCEKHICNINGTNSIGEIPFGKGYSLVQNEFDERLRRIVQLGYGLVIISHSQDKTFKNENGTEFNKIIPTLPTRANLVCSRMCDIIGYSRIIETEEGYKTFLFMRGTPRFEAGSRFQYTPDKIEFNYQNLINAIADAVDKQALENGNEHFTDERDNIHIENEININLKDEIENFRKITNVLVETDAEFYVPIITEIVEKYLGKGHKVSECNHEQAPLIQLINGELKDIK